MAEEDTEIFAWAGHQLAKIRSADIEAGIRLYETERLDGVILSPAFGYLLKTVSPVVHVAEERRVALRGVVVASVTEEFDARPLGALTTLRFLWCDGAAVPDLSLLSELEELSCNASRPFKLPSLPRLQGLYLTGYAPKSRNLTSLPLLENLRELYLTRVKVESLAGIERYKNIEKLHVAYSPMLSTVAAVGSLPALIAVEFDHCKAVRDLPSLAQAGAIERMLYSDSGELPDLRFIRGMKSLLDFRFVGTNVVDGDMSPLLGLKRVAYDSKRHFSHKCPEIKALIGDNGP
jgi:protein phosphatase 1 regulatory subunit 7